jgi:F420-0:gamma-glutamyl ligase
MHIRTIRTHKITIADRVLFDILDAYINSFADHTILAVTSKIVAICQGRVVPIGAVDKQTLIEQEADYFLPPEGNRYHVSLTIKENVLIPSAGIDESNSDHHYVLWPQDAQETAGRRYHHR